MYRPVAWHPNIPPPVLGQTFDQYLGFSKEMGDVIRLVFHGGGAWLGIHVGLKENGVLSALGWFFGLGHGIGAVLDVVSLLERVSGTHPEE